MYKEPHPSDPHLHLGWRRAGRWRQMPSTVRACCSKISTTPPHCCVGVVGSAQRKKHRCDGEGRIRIPEGTSLEHTRFQKHSPPSKPCGRGMPSSQTLDMGRATTSDGYRPPPMVWSESFPSEISPSQDPCLPPRAHRWGVKELR